MPTKPIAAIIIHYRILSMRISLFTPSSFKILPMPPPFHLVNAVMTQKICQVKRIISIRYHFESNIDMWKGEMKMLSFS